VPKETPRDLAERIVAMAAAAPAGISKRELAERFKREASARTIARRLAELVAGKALTVRGKARALRYFALPSTASSDVVLPAMQARGEGESYVPTSTEGDRIRSYVRKPISQRRPVGYRREFLEDYVPNKTSYLPLVLRKRLMALGRSAPEERPAGTYARDILNRLLVDLSWASSQLEGNTYTRLETQNLIEYGRAAEGKDQREAQMILNHKAAIEMLVDNVNEIGFNRFTFMNLHANLSENLLADPMLGGRLRTRIVEVKGTVFQPLSVPQQIEEYFEMILDKAGAIADPFEQAFFVMVQIPYLQPFIDVNKRVSRLGANIPLIKENLCPLSFVDVPDRAYVEGTLGIYELNKVDLLRDVFAWAYERSCQRFLAVQESVVAPDPVRLRNREALSTVISEIVKTGQAPTEARVRRRARDLVRPEDVDRFVQIALQELMGLHEGNIARFRLRLAEFATWRKRQALPK
jgi:hypothetical protein